MPTPTVPTRTFEHVAVLMGGFSAERPVSLSSGNACADALEEEGYRVTRVDVQRDLASQLADVRPDVCFNALHGPWGEDGRVQGLLEFLGIPYTHSGVLASALAMHKQRAKEIMKAAGVPVADGRVTTRAEAAKAHVLEQPYVLKPVAEGSSFGVFIVREDQAHPPQELTSSEWSYGEHLLAEPYIPGRELTCAVLGDQALGILEIRPAETLQFYNFEAKYAEGGSIHVQPDDLSPDLNRAILSWSLMAHRALGCRGVTRADFRYDGPPDGSGTLVCLEVNTQPGMTGTSLVPEIAANAGLSFGALLRWITEDASCGR
ncbi:MAG: D-alanine--D-alanine ligase [Pseudomonadota bacterium]